jgi:hypothetical protein
MPIERSIALNIIRSLVPLNLPGSRIISYLAGLNLTYRRTDMLSDIRTAFDRIKYETQVTSLAPDQVVPESWMSREEMSAPYNYRIALKVDYYDPDTGAYSTEHRYMFADEASAVGDYVEQFPDYALNEGSPSDRSFEGAQVVGITKNTRAGPAPF